jgi:hypothetical protein
MILQAALARCRSVRKTAISMPARAGHPMVAELRREQKQSIRFGG